MRISLSAPSTSSGGKREIERDLLLQRNLLHVEEHLRRVELEALDLLACDPGLQHRVDEDPWRVLEDDRLGLLVDLDALAVVGGLAAVEHQLVGLGALVVRGVADRHARRGEERIEEIIWVAVVAAPPAREHALVVLA